MVFAKAGAEQDAGESAHAEQQQEPKAVEDFHGAETGCEAGYRANLAHRAQLHNPVPFGRGMLADEDFRMSRPVRAGSEPGTGLRCDEIPV